MTDRSDVWEFPDVEVVLAGLLAERFLDDAAHAGSTTPANLDDRLPFVQVVRYGGGDDGVTDEAAVDVDWFATTRAEARRLAQRGHQFLTAGHHGAADTPLIDRITTVVGPIERPRLSGTIRRFGGSYTVSTRRTPV